MRIPRTAQAFALVGGLAIGAVACGSAGASSGDPGHVAQVSDLAHMPASVKPFHASEVRTDLLTVGRAWLSTLPFDLTPSENAGLYTLWQEATAQCMQAQGFDYGPIGYPPAADFTDLVNPLDQGYAEARGYHELPVEPVNPNTYDATVYFALEGTETNPGCAAQSWPRSFGAIEAFTSEAEPLRNGLGSAIVGFDVSDAGSDATQAWSTCMADKGRHYDSPDEAWIEFVERPTITDREISVRLDDLACDSSVGFTQARHDWQQKRVDDWMTNNATVIARLTSAKSIAIERLEQD